MISFKHVYMVTQVQTISDVHWGGADLMDLFIISIYNLNEEKKRKSKEVKLLSTVKIHTKKVFDILA